MSIERSEIVSKTKRNHTGKLIVRNEYMLHSPHCKNSEMDIAFMELKLQEDPECLERKNHYDHLEPGENMSALFNAVYSRHDNCVKFLIASGASVNKSNRHLEDAICAIIQYGTGYKSEMLSYVFKNRIYERTGSNPTHLYLHRGVLDLCKLDEISILINSGIPVDDFNNFNINLEDYSYSCPTVQALFFNNQMVLKHLLLHGAAVDYRQTGRTDLSPEVKDCLSLIHHFVVSAIFEVDSCLKTLIILYEFGANLWEKNRYGLTPVEVAQNVTFIEREWDDRNPIYEDHNGYELEENIDDTLRFFGVPQE